MVILSVILERSPRCLICSTSIGHWGKLLLLIVMSLSLPPLPTPPGEKLKILQVLLGKLLTLGSCRELMEDVVEEQKAARQELRELRAEQHRRSREEAAHRYAHTHTHTLSGEAVMTRAPSL